MRAGAAFGDASTACHIPAPRYDWRPVGRESREISRLRPPIFLLTEMAIGAFVSCLAALAAMHVLMKWLVSHSFMPFVIYRVLLGILLLVLIHQGVLA